MTAGGDDPVRDQYERWPYPAPPDDLGAVRLDPPHAHYLDLRDLYWAYWPALPYRDNLDILVAGCGTMAAAAYAFLFPRAQVLGIDISAASLAHEAYLRDKHGLRHLTLKRCAVEDAAQLGQDFDFIAVQGVLHHLSDPPAGLRALGGVLRRDGVASVMVYGRYARAGVYMLQTLFQILGLEQNATDLHVVKQTLRMLRPDHPVQPYLHGAKDLSAEHGLVDTFLHRRDRAYSVTECLELVEQAGLVFQGWDENLLYYQEAATPAQAQLRARLDALPAPRLWQAMELIHCMHAMHWFHVCRPDRDPASYRIDFEGDTFLDYVPVPHVTQRLPADPARQQPAAIARPPYPAVTLDAWQAALFGQFDGRRSVRQALQAIGLNPAHTDHVSYARAFLGSLWRLGYLLFCLKKD